MFSTVTELLVGCLVALGVLVFIPSRQLPAKYDVMALLWGGVFALAIAARYGCLEGESAYLPFFYMSPLSSSMLVFPALLGVLARDDRLQGSCIALSCALLASSPVLFALFAALSLVISVQKTRLSLLVPFIVLPACFPLNSAWPSVLIFVLSLILSDFAFSAFVGEAQFLPFIALFYFSQHLLISDQSSISTDILALLLGVSLLFIAKACLSFCLSKTFETRITSLVQIWFFIVEGTVFLSLASNDSSHKILCDMLALEMGTPLGGLFLLGMTSVQSPRGSVPVEKEHAYRDRAFTMTVIVGTAIVIGAGYGLFTLLRLIDAAKFESFWLDNIHYLPLVMLFKGAVLSMMAFFFVGFACCLLPSLYRSAQSWLAVRPRFPFMGAFVLCVAALPGAWCYFLAPLFIPDISEIPRSIPVGELLVIPSLPNVTVAGNIVPLLGCIVPIMLLGFLLYRTKSLRVIAAGGETDYPQAYRACKPLIITDGAFVGHVKRILTSPLLEAKTMVLWCIDQFFSYYFYFVIFTLIFVYFFVAYGMS